MKKPAPQPSILVDPPPIGRSLTFRIVPGRDVKPPLQRLRERFDVDCGIIGLGEPLVLALGQRLDRLRTFPSMSGVGCSVPSTQGALWAMLRGENRGTVFDFAQEIRETVSDAFVLSDIVDTFGYQGGRDLTRFEDGTENPHGKRALAAAIVGDDPRLHGSSFVAVQQWVHDLARFWSFSASHRDELMGRRADNNEEIGDAPAYAHVKRAAQESFTPAAFMLRRSMPWATGEEEGLLFISFVESLDRFESVLRRMTGVEDGVVDGLFSFSRPISGGYYWCPPVMKGKLDLSAIGL